MVQDRGRRAGAVRVSQNIVDCLLLPMRPVLVTGRWRLENLLAWYVGGSGNLGLSGLFEFLVQFGLALCCESWLNEVEIEKGF